MYFQNKRDFIVYAVCVSSWHCFLNKRKPVILRRVNNVKTHCVVNL